MDGLGDKATGLIKVKTSYETTDPTVDSQIIQMKGEGRDVPSSALRRSGGG
jgi:hypothetical protein